jgi:malonate-semialdehyde dehydrogenase (acetylating)/methylmalonate-semialdehyde dehydrogenase
MLKNYIDGEWRASSSSAGLDVENPSTGELLARVPLSTKEDVDRAVSAASAAFKEWKRVPASRRVRPLWKLVQLLRDNEDAIARILVQEMGKSLPDAAAEMKRSIENAETACAMPVLQQGDKMIECGTGIDGEVMRLPMGVFGMIAPFNFPAMVPFWFFPYAIATGNTFVLKPSELVPLTMAKITEYIHEAGFPKGVFNLVNGDRNAGEALVENPEVKGISFVGSTPVCRHIMQGCARHGKRCQAMGRAKNHLVAMPDAKFDDMLRNMITSCFGCAGQRCMASSVIVAVGEKMYRNVCTSFVAEAKKVVVANPLDPAVAGEPVVMGPVISAKAKAFIGKMIEAGVQEGAKLVLDGRGLSVPGCENGHFIGPTVFTEVKPGSTLHRTEIFGPVVAIIKADTLDEAIGIINDGEYGNGASIYTQNGFWARKFKLDVDAGMIGINVGIPAPVAQLPFGGMKASLMSDIKTQGKAIIDFYTTSKVVTERYLDE